MRRVSDRLRRIDAALARRKERQGRKRVSFTFVDEPPQAGVEVVRLYWPEELRCE